MTSNMKRIDPELLHSMRSSLVRIQTILDILGESEHPKNLSVNQETMLDDMSKAIQQLSCDWKAVTFKSLQSEVSNGPNL